MKKDLAQSKKPYKKVYLIGGISILVILVTILFWWVHTVTATYPLGNNLDYIGKKDSGCYISFTICDSSPSTTYYYATNLDQNELAQLFKHATEIKIESSAVTTSAGYTYDYITFQLPSTSKQIDISYYKAGSLIADDMKLRASSKKHVVSFNAKYYQALRNSLQ